MDQPYKNKSIESWLIEKVNDKYTLSVYDKAAIKKHYGGFYDEKQFYKYYKKDDIDVLLSKDEELFYCSDECKYDKYVNNICDVIEIYEDYDRVISHNPSSNIFHASTLFKNLVNFCESNNMHIYVPSIDNTCSVTATIKYPVIDLSMKKAFYEFCRENTF